MAIAVQTDQAYLDWNSSGVIVFVACGILSLISVLGIIIILGISVASSHDKTLFARTQVAKYFFSLLICNLLQSIGALFNIPWIVQTRVETGRSCIAHAIITQLGNVGTAIFSFVIAAHTFSQLVLRRQWSDLACHIALTASWGLLVLIPCFVVANSETGLSQGIVGYWCGIAPAYRSGRYASEYLTMIVSAAFSFILYSLVFLQLRGDFTVSDGYKVYFRHGSNLNVGSARTRIVTGDLTMVAKQMLPHPIAYTVLVLPFCATAFCNSLDTPVPFPATLSTAAVFVLSGFVNVVLFCTTRGSLPGSWKQKFGIGTTSYSPSEDTSLSSLTDMTRRLTKSGRRINGRPASIAVSITVEKDIDIDYNGAEPLAPSSTCSRITLPLRAHDGLQRDGGYGYHIQQLSFPPPLSTRPEGYNLDKDPSAGVHLASKANRIAWKVPEHPEYSYRSRESTMHGPSSSLEAPLPVYPPVMTPPAISPNTLNYWPPSISTSKIAAYQSCPSRPSLESNGSSMY